MRLSQAIRSATGQQIRCVLLRAWAYVKSEQECPSCALGGAAIACNIIPKDGATHLVSNEIYKELNKKFPELGTYKMSDGRPLQRHIIHCNDNLGWTRAQIADMVEKLGY